MKLNGMPENEIAAAIDATDSGFGENDHRQAIIRSLRTSLLDVATSWTDLQERASHLVSNPASLSERMIYLIGATIRSPLGQSLYLQASIARENETRFRAYPSIRRELIYPFFRAFWMNAASEHPYEFRTARSFTERRIAQSDVSSVPGVKELLQSMAFCLGVSLPQDVVDWLETP
jgi:hypothetical protein